MLRFKILRRNRFEPLTARFSFNGGEEAPATRESCAGGW
jgi:hypothetical protein